ncbi:MAG: hypothetical protein HY722_15890 [Planctomycetes bacterium]|nr:hypothetical protein [Planctomycetota bacterium]
MFVESPANRVALSACRAAVREPGGPYNPLVIYSGRGLGKTHLLAALHAAFRRRDSGARVLSLTAQQFASRFVDSIRRKWTSEFRERHREVDVLLLDDVQILAKRPKSQQELVCTLDALLDRGHQAVLTASGHPSRLGLDERLAMRLVGGMSVRLDPPDRGSRLAILRSGHEVRGLDPEVAAVLADAFPQDVARMLEARDRLRSTTPGDGGWTPDAVRERLRTSVEAPSLGSIEQAVTRHFRLPAGVLRARGRRRSVTHPRQVAMYLAREILELPLAEIGRYFGSKCHATVAHARDLVIETQERDMAFRSQIDAIRREVEQGIEMG